MNYGGFWIRFLAYLVDSFVVTVGFVGIMLLLGVMGLELAGAEIMFLVLGILYWALMQSSKRQATLGKALVGLKVGGPNGERISVGRSLGREVAKIISTLTFLIGYVIAAFTRNKQALHDFVASTYVVREGPSRVLAAMAIAVLALFAPVLAVMFFGAGLVTGMMGGMATMMGDVAMQAPTKPSAQAPKPAAPAPKPAAEGPKVATAAAPAATPAAPAAPVAAAPAKPVPVSAPAQQVAQAPDVSKSAPAPAPEPAAPVVKEPVKTKPVARDPAPMQEPPAPRIQTVAAGPVQEYTIRFNDLVTAVLYRDAGAVNDLLAFGKWPDKADSSGMTPLMIAASLGESAIAEALLKAGADPRRTGPGGATAISIARDRKDAPMLGLLQGKR